MSADIVAISGVAALLGLLAVRVPIGIAMALVGVCGFAAMRGWGPALNIAELSPIRTLSDYNLMLIPMFILMGSFATASGMSRELYGAANAWLGHRRGGLALAAMTSCGGFAAICGSSVATAATMTKVALPEMRKAGYDDSFSTGVIAAGGTLGILIPPSIALAVYGFITEQDIGKLFIAGIVPGLLALMLHFATIAMLGRLRPEQMPKGERRSYRERLHALSGLWAVIMLFVAVIGGMYLGVITPVEASAFGAAGALIIGVARRRLDMRAVQSCLIDAIGTSVSIMVIIVGSVLFGYFLTVTQVPQTVVAFMTSLPLPALGVLCLVLALFLIMGCILDPMSMVVLLIPIVFPVIVQLGYDPIWFGVVVVVTVELGLITPPVGMNAFVINTIAHDVPLGRIFAGVVPFILSDVLRIALLVAFPALVLWLPGHMI